MKLSVKPLSLAVIIACGGAGAADGGEGEADAWLGTVFVEAFDNGHYGGGRVSEMGRGIIRSFVDLIDPEGLFVTEDELSQFFEKWDGRIEDDIRSGRFDAAAEIRAEILGKARWSLSHFQELCKTTEPPKSVPVFRKKGLRAKNKDGIVRHWMEVAAFTSLRSPDSTLIGTLGKKISAGILELESMEGAAARDAFLDAAARAFDRQSGYYSRADHQGLVGRISLEKSGLGIKWDAHEGGGWRVKDIVEGGAADGSGLIGAGDVVLAVDDGGPKGMTAVDKIPHSKAKALADAESGKTVTLQVSKTGKMEDAFEIALVSGKLPIEEEEEVGGRVFQVGEFKVGVLRVPAFYSSPKDRAGRTVQGDAKRKILGMRGEGMDALVVDLRGDSGGSMEEAIKLAELFQRGDLAVSVDRFGQVEKHSGNSVPIFSGPLVVLVDGGSASAAEIFAKAMQDRRRGVVVGGRRTYGKGSMQNLVDLDWHGGARHFDGAGAGALRITTRIFFGPSGGTVQGNGVASDIHLPCPYDTALDMAYEEGGGELPTRAQGRIGAAGPEWDRGGAVSEVVLAKTASLSRDRTAAVPEFLRAKRVEDEFFELRKVKSVGTEPSEYYRKMKVFSDLRDLVEEAKNDRLSWKSGGDPYLMEAIMIAADIASLQEPRPKE